MTITQTIQNQSLPPFVLKRQNISFVDEKEIFLFLPTFLSVSLSFPSNWSSQTFTSSLDYASKHPMNEARFSLSFNSTTLLRFSTAYRDTFIPTYNIGRIFIGRGNSLAVFQTHRTQKIYTPITQLFEAQIFTLDSNVSPFAINTVVLSFNAPCTGFLNVTNTLTYGA